MEAQRFIIRYGCNDFIFEGSILELADIVRTLKKLTPALFDLEKTGFIETSFRRKPLIFSAIKAVEATTNSTIYDIDI